MSNEELHAKSIEALHRGDYKLAVRYTKTLLANIDSKCNKGVK